MNAIYKVMTYFRDNDFSFYPGETFPAQVLVDLGCDLPVQEARGAIKMTDAVLVANNLPELPPSELVAVFAEDSHESKPAE